MSLTDAGVLFPNQRPDESDPVKCRTSKCGWSGTINDTRQARVRSDPQSWNMLAGRDGWEYYCPRCGAIVASYYFGMS